MKPLLLTTLIILIAITFAKNIDENKVQDKKNKQDDKRSLELNSGQSYNKGVDVVKSITLNNLGSSGIFGSFDDNFGGSDFSSLFNSGFGGFGSNHESGSQEVRTITQHVPVAVPQPYKIIITKQIPVPQPYVVTISKPFPVPVHVKVPVDVPKPYAVKVPVKIPVAVPIKVPIEIPKPVLLQKTRTVKVPVEKPVIVKVPHPVNVPVPHPVPINVPHPVTVQVPHPIVVNQPHFVDHQIGISGISGFTDDSFGDSGLSSIFSTSDFGSSLSGINGFEGIGSDISGIFGISDVTQVASDGSEHSDDQAVNEDRDSVSVESPFKQKVNQEASTSKTNLEGNVITSKTSSIQSDVASEESVKIERAEPNNKSSKPLK